VEVKVQFDHVVLISLRGSIIDATVVAVMPVHGNRTIRPTAGEPVLFAN
jgi:hypothetical protein